MAALSVYFSEPSRAANARDTGAVASAPAITPPRFETSTVDWGGAPSDGSPRASRPAIVPGATERVVGRVLVVLPEAGDTAPGQHLRHVELLGRAVGEHLDAIADPDAQLVREVGGDRGLARARRRARHAGRVRVATKGPRRGEVGLEQSGVGRRSTRRADGGGRRGRDRQREDTVDLGVAKAREPRPDRRSGLETGAGHDLVDGTELFVRADAGSTT